MDRSDYKYCFGVSPPPLQAGMEGQAATSPVPSSEEHRQINSRVPLRETSRGKLLDREQEESEEDEEDEEDDITVTSKDVSAEQERGDSARSNENKAGYYHYLFSSDAPYMLFAAAKSSGSATHGSAFLAAGYSWQTMAACLTFAFLLLERLLL